VIVLNFLRRLLADFDRFAMRLDFWLCEYNNNPEKHDTTSLIPSFAVPHRSFAVPVHWPDRLFRLLNKS
jgi:hypothetical protein